MDIKRSQDCAERDMGQDDRDRRANPIMHRQKARRLQLADDRRAVLLVRHARVQCGQERHAHSQHKRSVNKTHRGPQPPRGHPPGMESRDIQERKNPAVDEVEDDPDQLGPVPVRREHRPEQVRDVHPRHSQPLAPRQDRGQDDRAHKAPQEVRKEVHIHRRASGNTCSRTPSRSQQKR